MADFLLRRFSFAVLIVVALANAGAWWWLNRPVPETDWTGTIQGLSFNPFRKGEDPQVGPFPTAEGIDSDLMLIADHARRIRTYSVLGPLQIIPRLAADFGIEVTPGAWINKDPERNAQEIDNLVRVVHENANVKRVIVGNESVLHEVATVPELIEHIRTVKQRVKVPVSTAEPWHVWMKYPELAKEVDYVAVHLLPYWEGVPAVAALDYVKERYAELRAAFPDKHILIGEVGWPSDGPPFRASIASQQSQAAFLRNFLNWAEANDIDYYVIEAFDQPWKLTSEGTVGAYWGIFDAEREPKFPMSGPLITVGDWPLLAAVSTGVAAVAIVVFLLVETGLKFFGSLFYASLLQVLVSTGVAASYVLSTKYATTGTKLTWVALSAGLILVALIIATEGLELVRVLWRRRLSRRFPSHAPVALVHLPKVSLHVPACNEPPQMVIETLDALAALDYPNFEVLLIDNNTRDPALWEPVKAHCEKLGPRFRFFHLDHCPGYKAGALNFALRNTADDAEIVGVIDSDYAVRANWLRSLIPYFGDASVGFVQAPQDYRDWRGNPFKRMCYWEFAGFFQIGMVERNERNAIIQHGTMTLVRRTALEAVGGWAEWCITEDAELGLRLLEEGAESVYIKRTYGRGVTPDTFSGYKKQRFRWAYGAIQILKRHWRPLFGLQKSSLTFAQRFDFVAGWAPWFADALNLLFTFAAITWSLLVVIDPRGTEFPLSLFLFATVALTGFKIVKSLLVYGAKVNCGLLDSLGAGVAGVALSHSVAKAVIGGLFTSNQPFLRTPKLENKPPVLRAVAMAWEELVLMCLLWAGIVGTLTVRTTQDPQAVLWAVVLAVQSLPYTAAVAMATVNAVSSMRSVRFAALDARGRVRTAGRRGKNSLGNPVVPDDALAEQHAP